MMKFNIKNNKGSALLIAILMSAVVLAVGFGVYQRTYKEVLFSSLWRQTQVSFGAADAGLECAIYRDLHPGATSCFGLPNFVWNPVPPWPWSPADMSLGTGCVNIKVTKTGSVSVAAGTLMGTYSVGSSPVDIAYDSINKAVWVTNSLGNSISKLDALTGVNAIGSPYPVGSSPVVPVFDALNNAVWVANSSSLNISKLIGATGLNFAGSPYTVGAGPRGIAYDGVNNFIWVANTNSQNLMGLDITNGSVQRTFSVTNSCGSVYKIAYDVNNNAIWAGCSSGALVEKINATTGLNTPVSVGLFPVGIAYDATNQAIWVANKGGNTVTKINANTNAVLKTTTVGSSPSGLAFDGTNVWVANNLGNSVTELDGTGTVLATFAVGKAPKGVAYDPADNAIWVVNSGDNTVTELSAGSTGTSGSTLIEARGYNDACGSTNPRRVERGLRIRY